LAAVRPLRPKPEIEDLIYCNPTTMIQIQARKGAVPRGALAPDPCRSLVSRLRHGLCVHN
jgi:hypothetical protein